MSQVLKVVTSRNEVQEILYTNIRIQESDNLEIRRQKSCLLYTSWDGAASLSQLAQSGTSKPDGCKFPEEVDSILVTDATEILDVTEKAKQSIAEVPVWKA